MGAKSNVLFNQHPIYNIVKTIADQKQLTTFAVGGVVRDLFLNRASKDIDILTLGSGIELALAIAKEINFITEILALLNGL